MNIGAVHLGWTYDGAADRESDLEEINYHLRQAVNILMNAKLPYVDLLSKISYFEYGLENIRTIMAECKRREEAADFRLSGDL